MHNPRRLSVCLRACVVIASLVVVSNVARPRAAVAADKPDVLFIAIDDLNDWIGCLGGHPQAKTPNIDRLASRGVLFTNAYCQAPICNPSRMSFMTGMRPSTTGMYLLGPTNRKVSPVLRDHKSMPEWFADNGYDTVGCGKIWHGGANKDTFQKYGPDGGAGPLPKKKIAYPMGVKLWDWGVFPERDDQMPDYETASWAIDRLNEPRDKPLFLAVGMHRPHVPLFVPQKWFDLYPLDTLKLPETLDNDTDDVSEYALKLTYSALAPRQSWMVEHGQVDDAVRAYLACISFVDAQVGRVLDALDKSPHANNTVIVLLSDHGFALSEKQRWAKRALWDRETKVPLIVAGPGIDGPRTCKRTVGLIDIYPTLVELCGLPAYDELEGRSLKPLLWDTEHAWPYPALTTFHYDNHAIRTERWRYIRYHDGTQELYDHDSDPNEWHNLAGEAKYADVIKDLAQYLPRVNAEAVPHSSGLGSREEDRALFNVDN
ncbi:MAG: sulfatase-like hydrolase/transferase [Phycisphaera sp.]|nr:sulfatase-like hydrolase/transferase [Phycisphaera sp.]